MNAYQNVLVSVRLDTCSDKVSIDPVNSFKKNRNVTSGVCKWPVTSTHDEFTIVYLIF